jgi:nucleoid-associated protein YgaU
MQKDLKIGMLVGLVMVTAVMLWLSIGPGLSPKARIQHLRNVATVQENSGSPNNHPTNSSAAIQPDSTIYSAVLRTPPEGVPKRTFGGHPTAERAKKIKAQRFHIVREGETLSEISRKYYDSANKWQKILDANREAIKDVSKLRPGTKIIIPE